MHGNIKIICVRADDYILSFDVLVALLSLHLFAAIWQCSVGCQSFTFMMSKCAFSCSYSNTYIFSISLSFSLPHLFAVFLFKTLFHVSLYLHTHAHMCFSLSHPLFVTHFSNSESPDLNGRTHETHSKTSCSIARSVISFETFDQATHIHRYIFVQFYTFDRAAIEYFVFCSFFWMVFCSVQFVCEITAC